MDICEEEKEVKYNNYCKYIDKDPDNNYTCKKCNLEKRRKTCMKIYGVDSISKSPKIKNKKAETMTKNGTDYGFRTQAYKDTLFKNYRVENISQSEEIKIKKENTCLKNYGVKNPLQSEEIKIKKENTCLKKYGVKYPSQLEEIKIKIENTCLKNYGVKNPSQSEEIHKKQHSGYILKHHQSGLFYRGSYELDFIVYCINNNIKIENFVGSINYFFNGKNKKYFPDFYIRKSNLIIEIKSLYTYEYHEEMNIAKKEAAIYSGFRFEFVVDKNYQFFDITN